MAKVLDISIQGDKELQRKFDALAGNKQRLVARSVLGKAATSFKRLVVAKVAAGHFDKGYETGTLLRALKATPRKLTKISRSIKHGFVGSIWELPARVVVGISSKAKGYYPVHVEFGWKHVSGKHIPANSYMRSTMNENKARLLKQITKDMGKRIDVVFNKQK